MGVEGLGFRGLAVENGKVEGPVGAQAHEEKDPLGKKDLSMCPDLTPPAELETLKLNPAS